MALHLIDGNITAGSAAVTDDTNLLCSGMCGTVFWCCLADYKQMVSQKLTPLYTALSLFFFSFEFPILKSLIASLIGLKDMHVVKATSGDPQNTKLTYRTLN